MYYYKIILKYLFIDKELKAIISEQSQVLNSNMLWKNIQSDSIAESQKSIYEEQLRLTRAIKYEDDDPAKISMILEFYELFEYSYERYPSWMSHLKTQLVQRSTEIQKDKNCSYRLWLRCEDFLVKYDGKTKFVPPKNWWDKTSVLDQPPPLESLDTFELSKWCTSLTVKGKPCRNYSKNGTNKCRMHR